MLNTDRLTSSDLYRAASASLAVVALFALALAPETVLAGTNQINLGLTGQDGALRSIRDFLTGPLVKIGATIAMIAVLGGVVMRSQRGESITSLAAIGASLLVIINIDQVLQLLNVNTTTGSMMGSPEALSSATEAAISVPGLF